VKARALLWIAAAALLPLACGERVQIGAETAPAPPPPVDDCIKLPCGTACPLDSITCSTTDCPPSIGGHCDLKGVCNPSAPVCAAPGSPCPGAPTTSGGPSGSCVDAGPCVEGDPSCGPCAGKKCGDSCSPCDPANPSCSSDAGTLWTCDGLHAQCNINPAPCP
jgi:hypothetical protein